MFVRGNRIRRLQHIKAEALAKANDPNLDHADREAHRILAQRYDEKIAKATEAAERRAATRRQKPAEDLLGAGANECRDSKMQ
jgi:hypothetical protein